MISSTLNLHSFFRKQVRQMYDMICADILPHVLITKIKNRVPDIILGDKVVGSCLLKGVVLASPTNE